MPQPSIDELRARYGVQPAAYMGDSTPRRKGSPPNREAGKLGPETYKERERRRLATGIHPSGVAAIATAAPASGEHCATCGNCVERGQTAGTYYKCLLQQEKWTGGRATDILRRWPACERWVKRGEGDE